MNASNPVFQEKIVVRRLTSNFPVSVKKYHDPKPLMEKIVHCGLWFQRGCAEEMGRCYSRQLKPEAGCSHTEPHGSREHEMYMGQA